jgi:deazaflavin-dependent oxidoreductase (nitroreductase family)
MDTVGEELPRTYMDCGCVFDTPPEGRHALSPYVVECDHHRAYPSFDDFKAALRDLDAPGSLDVVHRYNERIADETRAGMDAVRQPDGEIPERGTLLLTTAGARSNIRRVNPLGYQRDGDRLIIQATVAGRSTHPAWYHNLVAHPTVEIEVAGQHFEALARPLKGDEWERAAELSVRIRPVLREFFDRVRTEGTRTIPLVALEPLAAQEAISDERD